MRLAFALCVVASGGILLPYLLPEWSGAASSVLIYVTLAQAMESELGVAGVPDLAIAAYCATGTCYDALLTRQFGLPFWACLPLACTLTGAIALLLASPLLRARREFFAMMTLGFSAIVQIALGQITKIVPGVAVLNLATPNPGVSNYYAALTAAIAAIAVFWCVRRSPIGLALRAGCEDEAGCCSIGVDLRPCKQMVIAISAMIAGAVGCLLAAGQNGIQPTDFDFGMTAGVFAIVILGLQTPLGIFASGVAIAGAPQLFPEIYPYRLIGCGAVVILWVAARAVWISRAAAAAREEWNFGSIIEAPAE